MSGDTITIFWHRRDLRIEDNSGLYHALKNNNHVQPIFIFDKNILTKLEEKDDARVSFIYNQLATLRKQYRALGSDLWVFYGDPLDVFSKLVVDNPVAALYTNRDYEPYAKQRDASISNLCSKENIAFNTYKDHVIFEKDEVLKKDGLPYIVFTPYKRRWLEKLTSRIKDKTSYYLSPYPTTQYAKSLRKKTNNTPVVSLKQLGFEPSNKEIPPTEVKRSIIKNYSENRDYPSIDGTSRLGIHFRFGTISIREKAKSAQALSDVYLSELIWRDFYSQIMSHFPHVIGEPFREKYAKVPWRNNMKEFEAWCKGLTGYPIVDAGMRELNATGHMHNRVRMVTASFLTKHLLIDWRLGEAYFAQKLLDYDLASNNGGWQWAAGCGTDAAPYFRIFNPTSQMERFDKEKKYIKKWVSEWGSPSYPAPIVEHKMARERCLKTYKEALQ